MHRKPVQYLLLAVFTQLSVFASAAVADDQGDSNQVVVQRGEAALTFGDIDAMVNQLDVKVRAGYMDDPQRIERTLNGMLLARQLSSVAKANGLDESDDYKDRLRLAGENILSQMQTERHLQGLKVPDFSGLARERYIADDGSRFGTPERRDLSHILISNVSRDDAVASKLVSDLRSRIAKGESFDELAKVYSDDKPAQQPSLSFGSQPWRMKDVVKGATDPAFEAAAWELKSEGDISAVVKSSFGYHIIRLDAAHNAEKHPFDSVKKIIVSQLHDEWIKKQRLAYITEFTAQALEADPAKVASLRTRYMPTEDDATADDAAASDNAPADLEGTRD